MKSTELEAPDQGVQVNLKQIENAAALLADKIIASRETAVHSAQKAKHYSTLFMMVAAGLIAFTIGKHLVLGRTKNLFF